MNLVRAIADYPRQLTTGIAAGWTRFWFTPIDPTVLAVLRIAVGMLALYEVLTFTPDLDRLLGPQSLIPPTTVAEWVTGSTAIPWWRFSYFYWTDTVGLLWLAHTLGVAVLLLFTLGLWSRVTSVLSLIVVLSYVHRVPMLMGPFDRVLTMLLAYLCLAPTGAALSIDRWWRVRRGSVDGDEPPLASTAANVATRLLQVHVALIYVMMGLAKLWGDAWLNGEAVWWLAARPESRLVDLSQTLAAHWKIRDLWTQLVLLHELTFGVLIWIRLARPLLLALSAAAWLSLALVLGDVPFCLAMIAANLAFISPDILRGQGSLAAVGTTSRATAAPPKGAKSAPLG